MSSARASFGGRRSPAVWRMPWAKPTRALGHTYHGLCRGVLASYQRELKGTTHPTVGWRNPHPRQRFSSAMLHRRAGFPHLAPSSIRCFEPLPAGEHRPHRESNLALASHSAFVCTGRTMAVADLPVLNQAKQAALHCRTATRASALASHCA